MADMPPRPPACSATIDLMAGGVPATPERGGTGAMTMRDMTRTFGLTSRALRFYEERGLIAPERAGADRLYSRRDRARLRLVLMGKAVGFSLEEIRSMLDLYDVGDGGVTQLRVVGPKFRDQIAKLEKKRNAIDAAIRELARAADVVESTLSARGAG